MKSVLIICLGMASNPNFEKSLKTVWKGYEYSMKTVLNLVPFYLKMVVRG
jgi:hypothetical protein